jgi:phosphate uptake regulator
LVALVEDAMWHATAALLDGDERATALVVDGDKTVAAQQSDLDTEALDLLARQQPVAADLRTIVACLRMSDDLRCRATSVSASWSRPGSNTPGRHDLRPWAGGLDRENA